MIDFIKTNISYIQESDLLNNPLIKWDENYSGETGELKYPIEGKYYDMDIIINPIKKEIKGSLHVLCNEINKGENQNYNDFTFDDLKETIHHIKDVFNLNLDKTIIENLELGLNIKTDKSPTEILRKNLIVWQGMKPTEDKTYKGTGKCIKFEKDVYLLKLYDKGRESKQMENIIRIELHIKSNRKLNKIAGIKTLKDLLDIDKINRFLNHLYSQFDKCIILDDDKSGKTIIDPREKENFLKGTNPNTWIDYPTDTNGRKAKERFNKLLNNTLEKYNLNTIKKEIETKLKEKGEYLLKCHKIIDIEKAQDNLSESHKIINMPQVPDQPFDWSENTNMSQIHPYIYNEFVTSCKCVITGIDISHQTTNKRYLLESSIKEIREKAPETFMKLEREYRPQRKNIISYVDVCKEIAHRIRREYQTLKEKVNIYKGSLFPLYLPKLENFNECRGYKKDLNIRMDHDDAPLNFSQCQNWRKTSPYTSPHHLTILKY